MKAKWFQIKIRFTMDNGRIKFFVIFNYLSKSYIKTKGWTQYEIAQIKLHKDALESCLGVEFDII